MHDQSARVNQTKVFYSDPQKKIKDQPLHHKVDNFDLFDIMNHDIYKGGCSTQDL